MKNSATKIRTSHVGRLPAPAGFEDMPPRLAGGQAISADEMAKRVEPALAAIVKRQVALGIDCIGDGEFWSSINIAYFGQQMTGLSVRPLKPGEVGATRESTRERDAFPTLYGDMDRVGTMFCIPGETPIPRLKQRIVASGPIKTKGADAAKRQLAAFKTAIQQSGVALDEGFVPALAPGWLDHFIYNEHYKTEEEFVYALADAMSDTYRAIVDAGFILQLDDPGLVTSWDMIKPEPSLTDYRHYAKLRVDALNHALAGIPAAKVRYHFCWGSWHGPHTNDLPVREIVDIALSVNADTISFEAANARHEHEWTVWKDIKLRPGTILMPGVISHATNIVEHPELVAQRIVRWAGIVGRENVIAGADCGMGARVHGEIAWAKLASLTEGAAIASKALWGR
ncbi:MAG TPA: cobalamin-independent methionine synthase II family protein [Stellaceae bacterium]|nr:cobalamin-independent methionine synthase II family protein [Stellaceae bacterium]